MLIGAFDQVSHSSHFLARLPQRIEVPSCSQASGAAGVKDKSCRAHHEKVLEQELWVIMSTVYSAISVPEGS